MCKAIGTTLLNDLLKAKDFILSFISLCFYLLSFVLFSFSNLTSVALFLNYYKCNFS